MNWQPFREPVCDAPIVVDSTHDRKVMAAGQRRFSAIEVAATNSVEDKTRICGSEHS